MPCSGAPHHPLGWPISPGANTWSAVAFAAPARAEATRGRGLPRRTARCVRAQVWSPGAALAARGPRALCCSPTRGEWAARAHAVKSDRPLLIKTVPALLLMGTTTSETAPSVLREVDEARGSARGDAGTGDSTCRMPRAWLAAGGTTLPSTPEPLQGNRTWLQGGGRARLASGRPRAPSPKSPLGLGGARLKIVTSRPPWRWRPLSRLQAWEG